MIYTLIIILYIIPIITSFFLLRHERHKNLETNTWNKIISDITCSICPIMNLILSIVIPSIILSEWLETKEPPKWL